MSNVVASIRYARTRDGVNIAYDVHGSGPWLVYVRGWVSHLELLWERPNVRPWFEALAERYSVVRFDVRGNGLSDRDAPDLTLEGLVCDLEAVMDELGIEHTVLYAVTFGGPIAMAYAARHPERVTHLVLDGTYARGRDIASPERLKTYVDMLRNTPEVGGMAMSRATNPSIHDNLFARSQVTWKSISSNVAATLYELGFSLDVTDLLPRLSMPALVLHRRRSRAIPFELGRRLAAALPDARLVPLEGEAHEPWDEDPGPGMAALSQFLGVRLAPRIDRVRRPGAVTVLFTDLVDSTSLTQRLGDERAQEILRAHNLIVRRTLLEHGGTEVKHTGDGIMAAFGSASQAVEAALGMQARISREGAEDPAKAFAVKVGINAGEPLEEEQDLYGTAVQLAARLCDCAAPGEVLVAAVVRDLCAGKGFTFRERGMFELKGFAEPIEAWAAIGG